MNKLFIFLGLTALFIIGVGIFTQRMQGGTPVNLPGYSKVNKRPEITVGNTNIKVDIANDSEKRSTGLSKRESLNENEGMLFIFDEDNIIPGFWMKDMQFAIDIFWIDEGKIVQINNDVQPEMGKEDSKLTIYSPRQPIDYVLETKAGFAQKNGISVGDNVDI